MIEHYAPRPTVIAFDNLRAVMTRVFFDVLTEKHAITYIASGLTALVGYESVSDQMGSPVVTFKGLAVVFDPALPTNEMEFRHGSDVLAVVRGIS